MQTIEYHAKLAVAIDGQDPITEEQKAKIVLGLEKVINNIVSLRVGGRLACARIHIHEGRSKDYYIADVAYKLARALGNANFSILDLVEILAELQEIDPPAYDALVRRAA